MMDYRQEGTSRTNMRARRRRAHRNRTRLIYVCAVLIVCTALFLQFGGCGKKGKSDSGKAKSAAAGEAKKKKKDPAEAAREKAMKTAAERPELISGDDGDILMIVNKNYGLTKDYVPTDLTKLTDCDFSIGSEETKQLKKEAADALEEMFAAAREDGYEILMRTGYRSYEYQEMLYNSYVATDGQEAADKYSGRPGYSEHQSGLCCDLGLEGLDLNNFTGTDAAKWVEEHSWEYGFVVRYPEGKEDITEYIYESWHVRYVGREAAKYMHEHDMVLEEYLGLAE